MVVVGNTKIEGNAYLPEQGVKRGSIAGRSYTNGQLVYGTIFRSNQKLPVATNFKKISEFKKWTLETSFDVLELVENTKIIHPFTLSTKRLYTPNVLELENLQLTGNIILVSDTKIIVHASAVLKDIILIAPNIEMQEGVKGNFQALATENIHVAKNITLEYPSVLILEDNNVVNSASPQNSKQPETQISIAKNTTVKGVVAFLNASNKITYKPHIRIEEQVIVKGEVYCNQNIELKGTVFGSVYTRGFIANQSGSIYKNHIYNGVIIEPQLSEAYVGLSFENSTKNVAKWLYY